MSMQKVKVRDQRSMSQRSKQILPNYGRVQTVTPVWIHSWLRNDTEDRGGKVVLQGNSSNFMVTQSAKSTILARIVCFRTVTPVLTHGWVLNLKN